MVSMAQREVNLLCIIGVASVAASCLMPWIQATVNGDYSMTLLDVTGIYPAYTSYHEMLAEAIVFLVVAMAISIVTPIGGFVLLVVTLRLWYVIPLVFSGEIQDVYQMDYGVAFALAGSLAVMVSVFIRVMVSRLGFTVSFSLSEFVRGLRTFSPTGQTPRISPSHEANGPNMLTVMGVVVGACSLLAAWGVSDALDPTELTGLDVLMNEYMPNKHWQSQFWTYDHLSQIALAIYVLGLSLSVRSPLFGLVQLTGAISFWAANPWHYTLTTTPGPLIGVASSLVVIHSLVAHLSLSRKPKLKLGGHNIYTFVRDSRPRDGTL